MTSMICRGNGEPCTCTDIAAGAASIRAARACFSIGKAESNTPASSLNSIPSVTMCLLLGATGVGLHRVARLCAHAPGAQWKNWTARPRECIFSRSMAA
jgi:hypothetical protein